MKRGWEGAPAGDTARLEKNARFRRELERSWAFAPKIFGVLRRKSTACAEIFGVLRRKSTVNRQTKYENLTAKSSREKQLVEISQNLVT